MTNKGSTVYNNQLKNIASQFIDEIIEKADLKPFFWQKISNKYDFNNKKFEYIFDTQKVVLRTIALKRIKCSNFISSAASGFFSTIKISKKNSNNSRQYYLEDLFDLLNMIKKDKVDRNFKVTTQGKVDFWLYLLFYFPGLIVFCYMTIGFVQESIMRSERGMDTTWMPYMWPIKTCLLIGIIFLLIQGISELFKSYYAATKGRWPGEK